MRALIRAVPALPWLLALCLTVGLMFAGPFRMFERFVMALVAVVLMAETIVRLLETLDIWREARR